MRLSVFVLILLVATPAAARDLAEGADRRVDRDAIDVGARTTIISDPALDPFGTSDALTQFGIGLSRTALARGPWALGVGGRWEVGGKSARARGAESSFLVHSLAAVFEGRFHPRPWLVGFVRLAPGMRWQRASISDASQPADLRGSAWAFATDVSAGGALRIFSGQGDAMQLWLTPEVGYAWSSSGVSRLTADVPGDDPRRFGELAINEVRFGGPFARLSVTATF
jgi:hypothetical protein